MHPSIFFCFVFNGETLCRLYKRIRCCCFSDYCNECSENFHKAGRLREHSKEVKKSKLESSKNSQDGKAVHEKLSLGWYPNPKEGRPKYFNTVLPKYYHEAYTFKSDPDIFRKSFQKEADRQWCLVKEIEKAKQSISAVKSKNPANNGNLIETGALHRGDSSILEINQRKLKVTDNKLADIRQTVCKHQSGLYDSTGMQLKKPYYNVARDFDCDIIKRLDSLKEEIKLLNTKLDACKVYNIISK